MYIKSNMEDKEKIFLIDAYALIYRGYYAFIKNPRINSKGTDTSAIFGFMNSLLDLIKEKNLKICLFALIKVGLNLEMKYSRSIKLIDTKHLRQLKLPYHSSKKF